MAAADQTIALDPAVRQGATVVRALIFDREGAAVGQADHGHRRTAVLGGDDLAGPAGRQCVSHARTPGSVGIVADEVGDEGPGADHAETVRGPSDRGGGLPAMGDLARQCCRAR